ncbi:MAG: histidinol dehydrogenase, partial [Clostridia bacterium]|nr:histidinol dehydrogenase [Clostridia bacterium]
MIRIYDFNAVSDEEIFNRSEDAFNVQDAVTDIIATVKAQKDTALLAYTEKFDKVKLDALQVSEQEITQAFADSDPEFIRIMRDAAANIEAYHKNQVRQGFEIKKEGGIVLGQKITPLAKVGIYVPGGTAAYPSTVLMNSIPAKLAGVGEIVMVTPPMRDGRVNPAILCAAKIAGVDKIFKIGGAQAVAALAYGTESVPAVDKIVGPGNA